MSQEFISAQERRAFSRLKMQVPVELHQGGSMWELELLDISLTGLAVSEPDDWDADYSHPFNFVIHLEDGNTLPFIARYRKEATGGLDETALRLIEDALAKTHELAKRNDHLQFRVMAISSGSQ